MAKKSMFVTYVLWLVGGIFGLHHLYLERDTHAFLWWCTFGYIGCGWLRDLVYIPTYVADANEDEKFLKKHIQRVKQHVKPPFSITRFSGVLVVSYLWGSLVILAIPEDEVAGISWKFLLWLTPLACALGVWTVGNVGREMGSIKWPLIAAYATFPLYFIMEDGNTSFSIMIFASAVAFETFSKKWRKTPYKRKSLTRRVTVLSLCCLLYMSLWCSYFYFNAEITDSDGQKIPVREAIHHFFTSPLWTDVKRSLHSMWMYAQHHGWIETWRRIIDLSDPHGEQNAYKVLDLPSGASQSEITSKWRALSREFHPDKVKDVKLKLAAQEKFVEIQQAYEILSKIKSKRSKKNKKFSA